MLYPIPCLGLSLVFCLSSTCLYLKFKVASTTSTHKMLCSSSTAQARCSPGPSTRHWDPPLACGQRPGLHAPSVCYCSLGWKRHWKKLIACLYFNRFSQHLSGVECWCLLAIDHQVSLIGKYWSVSGQFACLPLACFGWFLVRYLREVYLGEQLLHILL